MKTTPIEEIKSGMILAKPVYRADDGRILLPAGFKLKPLYIKKIQEYNCSRIYIQDSKEELTEDLFLQPVKDKTRDKAYTVLQETIEQIHNEGNINPDEIHEVVREIVNSILSNSGTIYIIKNLRSYDEYTFSHSVNVCVLTTLIGSVMGYNQNELEVLATGALLHDIGKVLIDPEILNKPTALDNEEYKKIQEHPVYSSNLIRKSFPAGFLPASMALQHHEREDGSGYPYHLDSKGIHPFSKIVTVADVYDAMTAERIYKKAAPAHMAIQELKNNAGLKYNNFVVEHFMKAMEPHPAAAI